MTKRLEIYKCKVCGNMTEVVHGGDGVLWCCGRPMKCFAERDAEADPETHTPVVERTGERVKVTVGDGQHATKEDHRIQWIELIADDGVYRKYLKVGEPPEATFQTNARELRARAYCTQHGLSVGH